MTITQMLNARSRQGTGSALCMLHQVYMGQPVNGWLMSEKLDGFRGCWTGSELRSRQGHTFHAPAWFTRQLPQGIPLDGEIFAGRGRFKRVQQIVEKKTPVDTEWQEIRYCVFDAPAAAGNFEQRLDFCEDAIADCDIAEVVPHRPCPDRSALQAYFLECLRLGGEGVVLRNPSAGYEFRRSPNILKLKPCE